ncbi:alkaline-shock protein, partial [Subtercola boreus]
MTNITPTSVPKSPAHSSSSTGKNTIADGVVEKVAGIA